MALTVDIHIAQTEILRTLLFAPHASFTELCKQTGFSSDHFNFHIKKLIELKMVEKNKDGHYSLTTKGKEYSNQLDTDDRTIEKQPKTGILVVPNRKNNDGIDEFLVQKRKKQPFYDFYMCLTGKVRWGEELMETAARELDEETGLKAKKFELKTIYHKLDYSTETGELLEDKIFYCCSATGLSGKMMKTFEGGENHWLTADEIGKLSNSLIDVDDFKDWFYSKKLDLREQKFSYSKDEY
jgi:ADP-ribose pyrophosphatase YjhB (NUDIX family)/predicted transcriptional regulator